MSGISYKNKDWIYQCIKDAKRRGNTQYITSGGPMDDELISELRAKGYHIDEFSDFEIITWPV